MYFSRIHVQNNRTVGINRGPCKSAIDKTFEPRINADQFAGKTIYPPKSQGRGGGGFCLMFEMFKIARKSLK